MGKIIETSAEYKARKKKEKEDRKCPECGEIPIIIHPPMGFGVLSDKPKTVRCSCGCLYEYETKE